MQIPQKHLKVNRDYMAYSQIAQQLVMFVGNAAFFAFFGYVGAPASSRHVIEYHVDVARSTIQWILLGAVVLVYCRMYPSWAHTESLHPSCQPGPFACLSSTFVNTANKAASISAPEPTKKKLTHPSTPTHTNTERFVVAGRSSLDGIVVASKC